MPHKNNNKDWFQEALNLIREENLSKNVLIKQIAEKWNIKEVTVANRLRAAHIEELQAREEYAKNHSGTKTTVDFLKIDAFDAEAVNIKFQKLIEQIELTGMNRMQAAKWAEANFGICWQSAFDWIGNPLRNAMYIAAQNKYQENRRKLEQTPSIQTTLNNFNASMSNPNAMTTGNVTLPSNTTSNLLQDFLKDNAQKVKQIPTYGISKHNHSQLTERFRTVGELSENVNDSIYSNSSIMPTPLLPNVGSHQYPLFATDNSRPQFNNLRKYLISLLPHPNTQANAEEDKSFVTNNEALHTFLSNVTSDIQAIKHEWGITMVGKNKIYLNRPYCELYAKLNEEYNNLNNSIRAK